MSVQQAAALPAAVAVVSPGYCLDNRRRQPWHTAEGIAAGLAAAGNAVTLVSDRADLPQVRGLRLVPAEDDAALAALAGADRAYFVTGALELARMTDAPAPAPVFLVLASPRLHLREILALGPVVLWREHRFLALPLANALLPGWSLRMGFARSGAAGIVYLSETARRRYAALGLPLGVRIMPQVPARPTAAPPAARRRICYLGPALEARGAVTAIEAFEAVAEELDAELLLLIRPDAGPAANRRIERRVARSPVRHRIQLEVTMLGEAELAARLASVRVLLLPFRAPISEVPLVVIEAALAGRALVTLDAPGVGEIARPLGGLVAKRRRELPALLARALDAAPLQRPDAAAWTSWRDAVAPLAVDGDAALAHRRCLILCGADGAGKTLLLGELRSRLERAGIPTRHVWSRFRNYTSKPLLALLRLTGHNRKERGAGTLSGYHDLARAPLLARLFLALQLLDLVLDIAWRFRRPRGRLLLSDRCVLDTLVDLAIDTGLDRLVLDTLGRRLVRLLPHPSVAVVIERPVSQVATVRPDALADRHHFRRRALYRRLAEIHGLAIVRNDASPEAVADVLSTALAQGRALAGRGR